MTTGQNPFLWQELAKTTVYQSTGFELRNLPVTGSFPDTDPPLAHNADEPRHGPWKPLAAIRLVIRPWRGSATGRPQAMPWGV
ncbi:hypothetical protein GCM10023063_29730 [Arthrobacter methylotrophus]